MSNYPEELIRFNEERLLDKQEFDLKVESTNILEELLEAHGVQDDADRTYSKEVYKELILLVDKVKKHDRYSYKETTEDDIIDAFADINVFSFGAISKQEVNPIIVMDEVAKEINSRTGMIIDGKFTKDKSDEAKAKWYKANFDKARISKQG